MKRIALAFVCCLALFAGSASESFERERFFELRRADDPHYRGPVQARFGHEAEAIELLRTFLPERKAHEELAGALLRLDRRSEAAAEMAALLRLLPQNDPDREGLENSMRVAESLRGIPPQTVEFRSQPPIAAKLNSLGSWNVPVSVNGVAGDWIFDTGANYSVVSESEARRMRLNVEDSSAWVGGSTGKKNALRLAVAELRFGPAHLKNVVFLVLSDASLYVAPVKAQISGIVGLPVLRALGSVGISASGDVRIDPAPRTPSGDPNIYFDELTPIVEVVHAGRATQMLLDTGANAGFLYPSFAAAFTPADLKKLRTKREKQGGAGGVVKRKVQVFPSLIVQLGGSTVAIENVSLLRDPPARPLRFRDGVIGVDALKGGFTLDFRSMQLRLD